MTSMHGSLDGRLVKGMVLANRVGDSGAVTYSLLWGAFVLGRIHLAYPEDERHRSHQCPTLPCHSERKRRI